MSIQLVDNFYLNSSKPLDNRFVVGSQSYYTNRDLIDWKYVGMRVWDLNDGVNGMPYVWTGTTYSSENSVSIGGSGTVNRIPKFVTTTTVDDSIIYDDGTYVGVGNTTPVYKLDVSGAIRTTDGFIGNGATISNINADNITSGTLLLNRIQNSSNSNWLLTSGVGGPGQSSWVNPSTVTVGNATSAVNATNAAYATQVNVNSTSLSGLSNLVFANSTGNTVIYTNTTNAPKINPSTGNVGIGIGTSTWQPARLRVTSNSGSPNNLDPFSIGYQTGYTNFRVSAFANNSGIILNRFLSGGASASSQWISFGNPDNYDAITFAGQSIFISNGNGLNNSRQLLFGGPGDIGQMVFKMQGNSSTVLGGSGAQIKYNLEVAGRAIIGYSTLEQSLSTLIFANIYNSQGIWTNGYSATGEAFINPSPTQSFTASLAVNGYIKTSGVFGTSDLRLKNELSRFEDGFAIEKIMKLSPVLFSWNEKSKMPGKMELGLFAQEVKEVIPEAVWVHESENFKDEHVLEYNSVFVTAIAAIKDQQKIIESQEKTIKSLEDRISKIEDKF